MALEPNERTQTVWEWLELVIQVKSSQNPPDNTPGQIQLQKFEFEYAKIDENLKISKYPGEAEGFTEYLSNGVTLEMVQIPAGSFIMGAPENEEKSMNSERPQHKVNIQPFFIGKIPSYPRTVSGNNYRQKPFHL